MQETNKNLSTMSRTNRQSCFLQFGGPQAVDRQDKCVRACMHVCVHVSNSQAIFLFSEVMIMKSYDYICYFLSPPVAINTLL